MSCCLSKRGLEVVGRGQRRPHHVYHNRAINFKLQAWHNTAFTILWSFRFSALWVNWEKLGKLGKSVVASVAKFAYFPPARSLSQSVSQAVHNNSTLDWRGVTHNEPMLSIRHARPSLPSLWTCFCLLLLWQTTKTNILFKHFDWWHKLDIFCGERRSSSLFAFN